MTLALLCVTGVANAGEQKVIKSVDYSSNPVLIDGEPFEKEGYPFYRMSDCNGTASFEVEDGALLITNNSTEGNAWDLQPFIIDWFSVQEEYDYIVRIEYKSENSGLINISFGNWDASMPKNGEKVEASNDYQIMELSFEKATFSSEGNNHVLWQSRKVEGKTWIKKVEIIEITPDEPIKEKIPVNILFNSDLEGNDASCFALTQPGVGGPWMAEIEDGIGVNGSRGIKVVSADRASIPACQLNPNDNNSYQWATQFFISSPYKLPAGTKVQIKFDYKASTNGDADTQAHGAPGAYNHWALFGSPSFTTEWQSYENTTTLTTDQSKNDNPFYTVAFNLGKNEKETTFYFDNIELNVFVEDGILPDFEPSPAIRDTPTPEIEIGESGFATFVADFSMYAIDEITYYTAKYDPDENKVNLEEIRGTDIPLHTPVIVESAPDSEPSYYQSVIARVLTPIEDNDLLESDGNVEGNGNIYVLADGDNGVGFYRLAYGDKVPTGKAYLELEEEEASGREFIGFGGEATVIKNVKSVNDDNVIYNLAGQRVSKTTKGLYIVNGKKIVK